nr:glycosyltransferase family 4 protein [Candidatus Njordarchaeum guaymaensis]
MAESDAHERRPTHERKLTAMRLLWLNWRDIKHPWAGGAEIHLHEIAKRLANAGYDITVLSSHFGNMPREESIDGYRAVRVGDHYRYPLAVHMLLKNLVDDYDVVIEDVNKVPIYAPLRHSSTKRVLTIVHHLNRAIFFEELPLPKALIAYVLETMMPSIYTNFFGVPIVAVSDSTRRELLSLKANPSNVTVVQNGIDNEAYKPLANDLWKQKTSEPTIVYLGRLKRYKQPLHAIFAFELIQKQFETAKLVVIGEGEMLHSLKETVALHNVPNVHFTGHIKDAEKIELLRKAWITLQTSKKEGWGLGVIEAAACGTPSVVYDVPGLRDCVHNKVTGLIVKPRIEELASTAVALLKDEGELRSMSESALDHSKNFDWNKSAEKFGEILEGLS